jgi:hypothetical protein
MKQKVRNRLDLLALFLGIKSHPPLRAVALHISKRYCNCRATEARRTGLFSEAIADLMLFL